MIRVLLVDDHSIMREGLVALMSGQPDIQIVGQADDGRAALKMIRELSPDVVVMDIGMPGPPLDRRVALVKEIEPRGYEVMTAVSGTDAVTTLRDYVPDVVISDILLLWLDPRIRYEGRTR